MTRRLRRFLAAAPLALIIDVGDCSCVPPPSRMPPEVEAGVPAGPSDGSAAAQGLCNCHFCGSIVVTIGGVMSPHLDPLSGLSCEGGLAYCTSPAGK